jgi:hypothetical protein
MRLVLAQSLRSYVALGWDKAPHTLEMYGCKTEEPHRPRNVIQRNSITFLRWG